VFGCAATALGAGSPGEELITQMAAASRHASKAAARPEPDCVFRVLIRQHLRASNGDECETIALPRAERAKGSAA
jgi:hypothetical protein